MNRLLDRLMVAVPVDLVLTASFLVFWVCAVTFGQDTRVERAETRLIEAQAMEDADAWAFHCWQLARQLDRDLDECTPSVQSAIVEWLVDQMGDDGGDPGTSWLGVNADEVRDYGTGRWWGNWAKWGRRWTRADGEAARVDPAGFPTEASSSVVINGNGWNYPPGDWSLTWEPAGQTVTATGAGVDAVTQDGPGRATCALAGQGGVRILASGAITSLALTPPGVAEDDVWPAFVDPLREIGIGTMRDLAIHPANFCVEIPPADHPRLWKPDWSRRPLMGDSRWSTAQGVPIEAQARLANAAGVSYWWVCMPHLADQEYVQGVARVLEAELDPGIGVYLEHSNEIWNQGFPQRAYYQGLADPAPVAAGKDAARMFGWFMAVMGEDRVTPVVMGHQADGGHFARSMAAAVEAAGVHVEGVGCAMYMPPYPPTYRQWIARARADPTDLPTFDEVVAAITRTVDVALPEHIGAHAQLASDLGVPLMVYETGLSLYNPGPFGAVYRQVDGSQEAGDLLARNLALAKASGVATCCHYGYMGSPSGNMASGSWNLVYDYITTTPKMQAFAEADQ